MAVNFGSSPRTTTFDPSPPLRLMATPGRREMASAALTSGSSLILSADTKLAMASDLSCWLMAFACPSSWAVTITSSPMTTDPPRAASWVTVSPATTVMGILSVANPTYDTCSVSAPTGRFVSRYAPSRSVTVPSAGLLARYTLAPGRLDPSSAPVTTPSIAPVWAMAAADTHRR